MSQQRNFPVGYVIDWVGGNGHAVVVYGARFTGSDAKGMAHVTLKVFDPYDGKTYLVQPDAYWPSYKAVPGNWYGSVNLVDDTANISNGAKACGFFDQASKPKSCP